MQVLVIFQIYLLYALPLWMLLGAALAPLIGNTYTTSAALFTIAMVSE